MNLWKLRFAENVVTWIIITVGLPLTLVAIYSLRSMVKDGNIAPIYVINLLITDLLQFCFMIGREAADQAGKWIAGEILFMIHLYFLCVSIGFMVCVSLERYLVIAWPLWYRFRRTIKISVVVCVVVWILPVLPALISYFDSMPFRNIYIIFGIFLLLPLPLFIFFLGGTLKALSASRSVPSEEKRRIVGVLVLVLLIYLLLFLPAILLTLVPHLLSTLDSFITLETISVMFLKLSPLADLFLYIFMKRGAIDKLLSSLCRCRIVSDDNSSTAVELHDDRDRTGQGQNCS